MRVVHAESADGSVTHMAKAQRSIPRPSSDEVNKFLAKWRDDGNADAESGLLKLFKYLPANERVGDVLVKVAALNSIYSTQIYAIKRVAVGIVNAQIDTMLPMGDTKPVDLIASIDTRSEKQKRDGKTSRRNYSFATKYCAFHNSPSYPIYDSHVSGLLNEIWRQGDKFTETSMWSRDYSEWRRAVNDFREYFQLGEFSIREIDQYLWKLAKSLA
jgi:hypothetical protein